MLFAKPSDETARSIESRLEDLLASSNAETEDWSGTGAVPAPLQHAVDVLLELVVDLEEATHRRAGALALYQSSREIACACVGGGEPDVWAHEQPYEAPWVPLREGAEDGDAPRARGFSLFARADLDMRLQWPYLLGTPKPEGVVVDARWQAPDGFQVTVRSLNTPSGTFARPKMAPQQLPAAANPIDEADADATDEALDESRGEFFAGWFDDLVTDAPDAPADDFPVEDEVAAYGETTAEGPPRAIPAATQADDEAFAEDGEAFAEDGEAFAEDDEPFAEYDPGVDETYEEAEPEAFIGPAPGQLSYPAVGGLKRPNKAAERPHVKATSTAPATPKFDNLFDELREQAHQEPEYAEDEAVPDEAGAGAYAENSIEDGAIHVIQADPRQIRRPQWPSLVGERAWKFDWRRHWWAAAAIVVLFLLGALLGVRGGSPAGVAGGRAPFPIQMMRAIGLASPKFLLRLKSNPPGATIIVDGRITKWRTPAEIELPPGDRRIGLSLPDLGSVTTVASGKAGAAVPLEVPLMGSLKVSAPDPATPVSVKLDGEDRGFAPLTVREIAPGTHDLVFASQGQPPWSQTVSVPVRGDVRIVAKPFDLPASGVIHITATYIDDDGNRELNGATVLIDGDRRGGTPLTLELPRGPHSLRAEYRGESAPVQVIDLPGGNERYATFAFGTGAVYPKLVIKSPHGTVSREVATPVNVSAMGLSARDVREMWLHVRSPDGSWRRYAMNVTPGDGAANGNVVFPTTELDSRGEAPFYVSLLVSTGEEYFTDIVDPPGAARVVKKGAPTDRSSKNAKVSSNVRPPMPDEPVSAPPGELPTTADSP